MRRYVLAIGYSVLFLVACAWLYTLWELASTELSSSRGSLIGRIASFAFIVVVYSVVAAIPFMVLTRRLIAASDRGLRDLFRLPGLGGTVWSIAYLLAFVVPVCEIAVRLLGIDYPGQTWSDMGVVLFGLSGVLMAIGTGLMLRDRMRPLVAGFALVPAWVCQLWPLFYLYFRASGVNFTFG